MGKHTPRIFCDSPLIHGERMRLSQDITHHLLQVLRLKPGAELVLFDGRGGEYAGLLVTTGKHWVEVEVGIHRPVRRESPLQLTLGQAVSRGERMDYTLQKAVELGVQHIQPLETERSLTRLEPVRQDKKVQHWQAVVRSAAEQSGREIVPTVAAPLPLERWLAEQSSDTLKILLDPQGTVRLKTLTSATKVCLLSGPEGGLSEAEVQRALQSGFTSTRLGPRILRTETAAIAFIAALQAIWGDLGD